MTDPGLPSLSPEKLRCHTLADKIEDLINYIIDRRMGLGGAVPLIEETKKEIAQLLEE